MDDNNRRRRQNEPPYSAQDPRFAADQGQGRVYSGSSSDRYRPAALGSPATSRGVGAVPTYAGYYQEPTSSYSTGIPPNSMQYQSTYSQDQRQQQGFTGYNPDLMYNVTQQNPQNNVYESQQFQARQPAAMQMLSDVAAPYFPNEQSSTPAPPGLQASSSTSSIYQHHQQSPGDRASLLQQAYTPNVSMGGMPQQTPDLMEAGHQAEEGGHEAAYLKYQASLKQVFKNIIDLRLKEASEELLEISEWLLSNVVRLGLTVDESSLHEDRVKLWNEFNAAWKGIFMAQIDFLESNQPLQPPQTLMTQAIIKNMATTLIRLCDGVEKYGLVDYEYGVAEEEIINVLVTSLTITESVQGAEGEPSASSSAVPSRGKNR